MAQTPVKFIFFGCVHAPLQDPEAVAALLEGIRRFKPDVVIHGGDGHEADAACRFHSEYEFTLEDEYASHNAFLADLHKAAPNAQRVFLLGNHDNNLLKWGRLDKRVRKVADFRLHEPELTHWKLLPYLHDRRNGCFRIGQVVFIHGFSVCTNADELETFYFTNEYGLCCRAHTHRPTVGIERCMRTKRIPLRYWYANAGCLRHLKPEYVKTQNTEMWGHAYIKGEALPLKSPRLTREWSAEVVHISGYDEWQERRA